MLIQCHDVESKFIQYWFSFASLLGLLCPDIKLGCLFGTCIITADKIHWYYRWSSLYTKLSIPVSLSLPWSIPSGTSLVLVNLMHWTFETLLGSSLKKEQNCLRNFKDNANNFSTYIGVRSLREFKKNHRATTRWSAVKLHLPFNNLIASIIGSWDMTL